METWYGDFRDWPISPNSVDLIVTDPPYAKKYQDVWGALGAFAETVLKPGGSLLTLCGHYQLPFVIQQLSERLKYRWTIALIQTAGAHPRMAMGIEVTWKPILWYVKHAYPQGRGFLVDSIISPHPEKSLHPWQQTEAYYEWAIRHLLPGGGVVCDPMAGSWTIGRVGERLGVQWCGCDIETQWA